MPYYKYHINLADSRRAFKAGDIGFSTFARNIATAFPILFTSTPEDRRGYEVWDKFRVIAGDLNATRPQFDAAWEELLTWADTPWGDDTRMCEIIL